MKFQDTKFASLKELSPRDQSFICGGDEPAYGIGYYIGKSWLWLTGEGGNAWAQSIRDKIGQLYI